MAKRTPESAATVPADPTHRTDGVLRLALASLAADPLSPLTRMGRQAVLDLLADPTPLTAEAVARWQAGLLAWAADRMPRCVAMLHQQLGRLETRVC
jgi:hypothetical protein